MIHGAYPNENLKKNKPNLKNVNLKEKYLAQW